MTTAISNVALSDEHRKYLNKEGLLDEYIDMYNLSTVTADKASEMLGREIKSAGILFRYPGIDYFKIRPDNPQENRKYEAPIKKDFPEGNALFITHSARNALKDNSRAVYFVEGEKKALSCEQIGLPAISISGVWNWRESVVKDKHSRPIKMLTDLPLKDRIVYIVFDSDKFDPKKNVLQAERAFASCLSSAFGAKVKIVNLDKEFGKGADDQILRLGESDFRHYIREAKDFDPDNPAACQVKKNTGNSNFEINSERVRDFLAREKPPLTYLINGKIPDGGAVVVVGPDKVGKSIYVLNLIRPLTTNEDPILFSIFPVNDSARVLYLAREGGEGLNDKRIRALFPNGNPDFNFKYLPQIDLLNKDWRLALEREIERTRGDITKDKYVLVLDPIRCFWSGEENDSGKVRGFTDYLDELRERYKLAVIITAHTPKPQKGAPWGSVSGSHQWTAWADVVIGIESRTNPRHISCKATRDGEPWPTFRANLIKDKYIFEYAGLDKPENSVKYDDSTLLELFNAVGKEQATRQELLTEAEKKDISSGTLDKMLKNTNALRYIGKGKSRADIYGLSTEENDSV